MSLLWDQCCRCTGWISYEQGEESVVCPQCGERMHVFKLRGEQSRINQELLSGRQAQRALNATQKEAHEAQERLNRAVAALGDIRHSQEKEENILRDLSQQIGVDQEAVRNILHEMRDEQSAGQDALRYMIGVVLRGQGSGVEKIETLHFAMEKMMEKQSNAETVLKALEERMQLDAQQRETLMREMDAWNKKEFYITQPRLAMIKADTEKMLASQQQLAVKMEKLQSTVEAATEKLVELHSSGQQSREDRLDAILQRAEELRAMRDFKEAEIEYRKYLEYGAPKYDREPEIYWRILQSHYGIVYEYSGMTESYVPTLCHPDLNNRCKFDREKMLKFCATDAQRRDYEKRLQEIDDILAEYSALIGQEDYCYDVFISVKHGDGKGGKTRDSALAQELWSTLTKWGLKTFNSECSRLPLGKNYEPHIIAALLSAKVMIVVGTSSEHMNAPWVRNEWQRFLWLQEDEGRAGLRERELFCYLSRNMDEKTLPEGLSAQKQLLREGFGAEEKLKDYLHSMFPEKMNRHSAGNSRYRADTASTDAASNASLNQMKIWLGMGKYQLVQEKYNEMVQKGEGMDSVYTYLYALCAANQKTTVDQLVESDIDLSSEQLYLYAKNFSREQELLQQLLARNQGWHEAERRRQEEIRRQQEEEEKKRLAELERKRREAEERQLREEEEQRRRAKDEYRRRVEAERKHWEEAVRKKQAERDAAQKRQLEKKEREGVEKEYNVNYLGSGEIEIIRYLGNAEEIVIPKKVVDSPVVYIGKLAFSGCRNLKRVIIPEGVIRIDARAFWGCSQLEKVILPQSLQSIEDAAFASCYRLKKIIIPNGVKRIGEGMFYDCNALETVILPPSVVEISENAFAGSGDLTLQVEQDSYAYTYALEHQLKAIILDADARIQAEQEEKNENVVHKKETQPSVDSIYQYKISVMDNVIICRYMGKALNLTVPRLIRGKPVETIGQRAFSNAEFTESIVLPDSVRKIEEEAFLNCKKLRAVKMAQKVVQIGERAFYKCPRLSRVMLPEGIVRIGNEAFAECGMLERVYIPESVTEIGKGAFKDCPKLVLAVQKGSYAHKYAKWHFLKTVVY